MASLDDKLYMDENGHAWVGEAFADRYPTQAKFFADLPVADDPRWQKGKPSAMDVEFITLSPFYPSGRLGVCVEKKVSNSLGRYPNHPPFEGCIAWMSKDDIAWRAIPMQPNLNPDIEKHTEIPCGYLSNLSLKDFTAISLALEKCWHASQNLGVSSQNACDQAFHETVSSALRNMLPCDLEKIERRGSSLQDKSVQTQSPTKRRP